MDTYAFVLALVAVGFAVGVSITCRAQLTRQASQLMWLDARSRELSKTLDELTSQVRISTPVELTARIDDLAAAVKLRDATLRRELGRLWKKLGGETAGPAPTATSAELDAMLELQRAHSAG